MAAAKAVVLIVSCKYCSNKVKSGIKCIKCSSVAHPSCAKRLKNIIFRDDGMICCQENVNEVHNLNAEESLDLSFNEEQISFDEPLKKEIMYLKTLLKHKNYIIQGLKEKTQFLQEKYEQALSSSTSKDEASLKLITSNRPEVTKNFTNAQTEKRKIENTYAKVVVANDPPVQVTASSSTYKNKEKYVSTSQVKTAILQATQVETMRNMQQPEPNHIKESNNEEDEGWEKARGQHRRKRRFLVGQSDQFSEIQTVPKSISLHITRLKPGTKPEDLEKILKPNLPGVKCEVHQSKHRDIYGSMKVTINKDQSRNAWKREIWPNGVLVSHFLARKRMPENTVDPQAQT
ncbi:hypothetical protein JTB14_027308 [Gonioctena quinquepunctata]|nr:hypothetical protein JTB14_027308 [Gonioctena quinquepunctata]